MQFDQADIEKYSNFPISNHFHHRAMQEPFKQEIEIILNVKGILSAKSFHMIVHWRIVIYFLQRKR